MPHQDPEWWLRCAEIKTIAPTDLCTLCGHVRSLHTDEGGCCAQATSLVDAPYPCDCTNRAIGNIFRDAATLIQVTSRG